MAGKMTITPAGRPVVLRAGGAVLAETSHALVLTENGYPPVYYLPREDVGMEFLDRSEKVTACPHKGEATHYDIVAKSGPIRDAAWSYEAPKPGAEAIAGYLAFYPSERVAVEEL